jgi:hypothetical protein
MAPSATSAASAPAPVAGPNSSRIQADPELVQYPTSWAPLSTPEDFYARAKQVADLLHADEAVRDRGNVVPHRQVSAMPERQHVAAC